MDDILEADLAVEDRALLAALAPVLDPLAPFFDLDSVSLAGDAGVMKGAGEAVAEGSESLLLSAAFFLDAFFGLAAEEAAPSFEEPATGSVSFDSVSFFLDFLGLASVESVFGLAGFLGFVAAGFGVEPSTGMGDDPAMEVGLSVSIFITATVGYG